MRGIAHITLPCVGGAIALRYVNRRDSGESFFFAYACQLATTLNSLWFVQNLELVQLFSR